MCNRVTRCTLALYGALPVLFDAELWPNIGILICASSLQNLSVPRDFYSPLTISVVRGDDPVFDGVRLAGFESRTYLLAKPVRTMFVFYCFPFHITFFLPWVCIVGLRSSDWYIECQSLSPGLSWPTLLNNNHYNMDMKSIYEEVIHFIHFFQKFTNDISSLVEIWYAVDHIHIKIYNKYSNRL